RWRLFLDLWYWFRLCRWNGHLLLAWELGLSWRLGALVAAAPTATAPARLREPHDVLGAHFGCRLEAHGFRRVTDHEKRDEPHDDVRQDRRTDSHAGLLRLERKRDVDG